MKTIRYSNLIFILILSLINITAQESHIKKTEEVFLRMMKTSQPQIEKQEIIETKQNFILSNEIPYPIFDNFNLITDETGDNAPYQNESSIAINPKNPLNIIGSAVDYRGQGSAWVYVSSNGGKTWNNKNLGKRYGTWSSSNDPSVAFDPDGVCYVVNGAFTDASGSVGNNGVFITKSTDNGNTWTSPTPIIVHIGTMTLDSSFEDKYYITVDNTVSSPYYKRLYVPWKRVTAKDSATQIVLSWSSDNGNTWSVPSPVSKRLAGTSEDTTYGQSFPLAASGHDGTVYMVWNNGIVHGVAFAKSTDGGYTFTEPKILFNYNIFGKTKNISGVDTISEYRHTLKDTVRGESYPVLVCDTTNGAKKGNLYLCWAADNPPNVYFSYSTNKGDNWSKPVIVHSDTTNDQFFQWLSLDPSNGDIAIMYLDSRRDIKNIYTECYISFSSDGGKTWVDRLAADVAGDIRNNPFGRRFAGDYSGCAFFHGKIFPSWVDMRATSFNSYDSDIFTAYINVRSPNPVDSFIAVTIPESPDQINLSWVAPKERTFGQPLNADEFNYVLYRDGTFLANISSTITNYTDKNLPPYDRYDYSIVVAAGNDTSIVKKAIGYAGGARKPAAPDVISAIGNTDNGILFTLKLPSYREDLSTVLTNFSGISIYRNGIFVKNIKFNENDTGKVVQVKDTALNKGYYDYYFTAFDDNVNPNISLESKSVNVYTGMIESLLFENFDKPNLPRYNNFGNWGLVNTFSYSSQNSLAESPIGKYKNSSTYTYWFFPVNNPKYFEMYHAAVLNKGDTVYVDVSNDMGSNWETILQYGLDGYPPWQDKVLNKDDWKFEQIAIKDTGNIIIRLRLQSNTLLNEDGWYVDNVNIGERTYIEDVNEDELSLYPNPCSDFVILKINEKNFNNINFKLLNIMGNEIPFTYSNLNSELILNLKAVPQGIYTIKYITEGKVFYEKLVLLK